MKNTTFVKFRDAACSLAANALALATDARPHTNPFPSDPKAGTDP